MKKERLIKVYEVSPETANKILAAANIPTDLENYTSEHLADFDFIHELIAKKKSYKEAAEALKQSKLKTVEREEEYELSDEQKALIDEEVAQVVLNGLPTKLATVINTQDSRLRRYVAYAYQRAVAQALTTGKLREALNSTSPPPISVEVVEAKALPSESLKKS